MLETAVSEITLLDWKRRIFGLYGAIRDCADPAAGWARWRTTRDELFASHPQSPLDPEQRAAFAGAAYHAYDPAFRTAGTIEPADGAELEIGTSTGERYPFRRFAAVRFELAGAQHVLPLYWLIGYGGGLFVPFADATNGDTTYGAGRYLLDTVKGADLGMQGGQLVLDFNFAYNPSCAYRPDWTCPLAPPESRLDVPVVAGEMVPRS